MCVSRPQIRLSTTLATVATALILRFRFNDKDVERNIPQIARRIQYPVSSFLVLCLKDDVPETMSQLGCIFFVVSIAAVIVGIIEYWVVQKRMARHMAFVESGLWVFFPHARGSILIVSLPARLGRSFSWSPCSQLRHVFYSSSATVYSINHHLYNASSY